MSTYPGYSNLGEVVRANQTIDSALDPRCVRNIIMLLAASVALMMAGFGIIMPVFARRRLTWRCSERCQRARAQCGINSKSPVWSKDDNAQVQRAWYCVAR